MWHPGERSCGVWYPGERSCGVWYPGERSCGVWHPGEWSCGVWHLNYSRKMVPITGQASSFFVFLKQNREEGGQNNNRPINLPKVITFSTDYKYTT